MIPENPLDELFETFEPIGHGIMEYYIKKFSEIAMGNSMDMMKEMFKEEYHKEMMSSLNDHFTKLSSELSNKLHLTFFHALLAILTGRIQDFSNFEQGLAVLLRTTLLKK